MLSQFHHRKVHHGGLFKALSIGLFNKSGFHNKGASYCMYAEFLTLLVLLLIIKKLEKISK